MVNMANPMPSITPKIFISHAWEDKALVRRLETELKAAGAEVWVDHSGVRGGDNLPERISEALAWCDTILLIWSEAASQSHWVKLEWTNALSLRKTIIPCLVSQVQLPALLANILYVDCRDFADGFKQLSQALQLESPSTERPSSNKLEPTPASAIKERRIDAAVPSAAEVGRPIDLRVQVRFPDSPRLGLEDWPTKNKPAHLEQATENVALEFPVDPATGKLGSARLEIHVVAPDFDIAGNARQILLVPPDTLSKCLSFLITPKRIGVCRLNVEVYNIEHIFLGAIPIETEVGGEIKSPSTNVANLFLFVTVGQEKTTTRSGAPLKPKAIPPPAPAPSQTAITRDGKIIQAGRDVIIQQPAQETPARSAPKSLIERWQLWVALLTAIAALIAGMPKIITEYRVLFPAKTARFSGSVYDSNGRPVAGAILRVQGKRGEDTTDAHGNFDFKVEAEPGTQIRVTVTKDGRVGYDELLWLTGNSKSIPFDTTNTRGQ